MGVRLLIVSAVICAATGYGAYAAHYAYDAAEQAAKENALHVRMAHEAAVEQMGARYQCLAEDSTNWCNRDVEYRHYFASALRYYSSYTFTESSLDERNRYVIVALIAGLVSFSQLRKLLRQLSQASRNA